MIIRTWMTDSAKEEINDIAKYLPQNVIEHTVNLIEEMDGDTNIDYEYRCRIINVLFKAIHEDDFRFYCGSSNNYDACHEFCMYLDGWVWRISGNNPETGGIRMICCVEKQSPLA